MMEAVIPVLSLDLLHYSLSICDNWSVSVRTLSIAEVALGGPASVSPEVLLEARLCSLEDYSNIDPFNCYPRYPQMDSTRVLKDGESPSLCHAICHAGLFTNPGALLPRVQPVS